MPRRSPPRSPASRRRKPVDRYHGHDIPRHPHDISVARYTLAESTNTIANIQDLTLAKISRREREDLEVRGRVQGRSLGVTLLPKQVISKWAHQYPRLGSMPTEEVRAQLKAATQTTNRKGIPATVKPEAFLLGGERTQIHLALRVASPVLTQEFQGLHAELGRLANPILPPLTSARDSHTLEGHHLSLITFHDLHSAQAGLAALESVIEGEKITAFNIGLRKVAF